MILGSAFSDFASEGGDLKSINFNEKNANLGRLKTEIVIYI